MMRGWKVFLESLFATQDDIDRALVDALHCIRNVAEDDVDLALFMMRPDCTTLLISDVSMHDIASVICKRGSREIDGLSALKHLNRIH